MIEFSQHAPSPWFDASGNDLLVHGVPLIELAQSIGRTPFYAYDKSVINRKIQLLRDVLPKGVRLHYAVKANPMPEVVQHILALVDGLDVASVGELRISLHAGAAPDCISFAGPGKTDAELREAAEAGITINVESTRELDVLAEFARDGNCRPRIALRVNPDFELKSSGMRMGGGPRQFGIDAELVPDVLAQIAGLPLDFSGFHIFAGSQNLRPDAIIESQRKSLELAYRLSEYAPAPVRTLNIGGGFGIPYFPGEMPLDLRPIGCALAGEMAEFCSRFPDAELVIELGRFMVGESGLYVCRVIDRKISRGHVFLVTDGGLHHHLAASGNFGQVLRKNYPVLIANRVGSDPVETVSIVGPLCTPLDLLGDRIPVSDARPGDLVAVFQSGAYGLTASPLGFLNHPEPAEVLV